MALKGAIRDVFAVSSMRRELSPIRALKWPVQHIECLSSATCVTCHVLRRESSAIKFDRAERALI